MSSFSYYDSNHRHSYPEQDHLARTTFVLWNAVVGMYVQMLLRSPMLRILLDFNYVGMMDRLFPPGMLDTTYYLLCGRIQIPSWMMTAHGRMYTRIATVVPTVILISRQHTFFPAGMILVAWLFGDMQHQTGISDRKEE
jgi:hypothetical protein